jgi:hypothetical protein
MPSPAVEEEETRPPLRSAHAEEGTDDNLVPELVGGAVGALEFLPGGSMLAVLGERGQTTDQGTDPTLDVNRLTLMVGRFRPDSGRSGRWQRCGTPARSTRAGAFATIHPNATSGWLSPAGG